MSLDSQNMLSSAPATSPLSGPAALGEGARATLPDVHAPAGPLGGELAASPLTAGLAGASVGNRGPGSAGGRGPFNPMVNSLLVACYGHMLDGITVAKGEGAKNRGMGAEAHTIDRHISLGDRVNDNPKDGQSMEIIGHEVAHALARGGSGLHVLDKKGDPGEHLAYDAGRQFRQFAERGGQGPAPQLKPAFGGLAAVHRFEGGEHKDAVDNAAQELKGHGVAVDSKVADLLDEKKKITLKNGVKVSPGDITAMMGDFYGAFNEKDGKFNPAKSYEAMQNANPDEMSAILEKIRAERTQIKDIRNGTKKDAFKETSPGKLEDITKYRNKETKDGVTTGYSMLELADRNKSHFSKQDESGTDNNMGAYNSFHAMALEQAKAGNMEEARALEASGMHYLTDRFAGGHQFDKDKVAKAFKDGHVGGNLPGGDLMATGAIRIFHNAGNEQGVDVTNSKGESWHALGDSHWMNQVDPKTGEDPNAKNRLQASRAVYDSFAELQAVADGKKDPNMKPQDYAAKQDVPVFDQAKQTELEKQARETNRGSLATHLIKPAADVLVPTIQRALVTNFGEDGKTLVKNWDKAWDWTKESFGGAASGIGQGIDWLKDTAGQAGTGIKNGLSAAGGFAKDTLREAGAGIGSGLGKAGDFIGGTASDAATGIKNGISKAGSWASETMGASKDGIGGGATSAWNWFTGAIGGAVHQVKEGGPGSLVDYAKEKVSEAGTGIHKGLGKASDFAAQKVGEAAHGLRSGAGEVHDFAADKLSQAGTGLHNGFDQASDFVAQKLGQAGTGIRNGAGQVSDWADQKGNEVGSGIHKGLDWTSRKYGEAKDGLLEHGRETWDATKGAARTAGRAIDQWVDKKTEPYITPVKNFVSEQYQGLRAMPGQLAADAGSLAHSAGTAIHNGAGNVESAASGALHGAKGAVSSGWGWLKHKAGY